MAAQQLRSIDQPSYFRTGISEEVADIDPYLILAQGSGVEGVVVASGPTDTLVGVAVEKIAPGEHQSYQMDGKAVVRLGGTVSAGAIVTTNAAGKAVAASFAASSTTNLLGRAVTGGSADELAEVELFKVGTAFIGSSTVTTRAALTAIAAADRYDGQTVLVQSDNSLWRFNAAAAMGADTAQELCLAPDAGTGRWIRVDKAFVMKIPVGFGNTDGQAIETIPEGFALRLAGMPYWEITTPFSGGSSSAIGISTNITGYETGGDILGGATGDTTAVESAGIAAGTLGGELDDHVGLQALLFEEGSQFQFDRITSAYTAGAGFACVPVIVALAPATP